MKEKVGWSGGAKVLGKPSVPGRPTGLVDSRARAYCACSRCGWGFVWTFLFSSIFSFLSPSLWETARYRLKYCLKGPLNPKQPTNQPTMKEKVLIMVWIEVDRRITRDHCWALFGKTLMPISDPHDRIFFII